MGGVIYFCAVAMCKTICPKQDVSQMRESLKVRSCLTILVSEVTVYGRATFQNCSFLYLFKTIDLT